MENTVYLDICCFKRPFDDARNERIRREAEAVVSVFEAVQQGRLRLVRSPAHMYENDRNPREDRRLATAIWLELASVSVDSNQETERRTRLLVDQGHSPLDAAHLAYAEQSGAKWFLTTDDRLLKRAQTSEMAGSLTVLSPDQFDIPTGDGDR